MSSDRTLLEFVGQIDRPMRKSVRSVVEHLFAQIQSRRFPVGTRLPAERSLAKELDVSRSTIRGALEILEEYGVITRRQGSGAFITFAPQTDEEAEACALSLYGKVTEATSPLELQVVRSIIEPEMVRLAIINMAHRDVEVLREILGKLEAVQTDAEKFTQYMEDFYMQLARGTDNPLLVAIYELIRDVRRQSHWVAHKKKIFSPGRIREFQLRHRSMFLSIERRDIESAVEYAKLQLVDEQRLLTQ